MSLEQIWPDIQKAAKDVAVGWPEFIESDDLAQELVVEILESPKTLEYLINVGKGFRELQLHKMARRKAGSLRDDYEVFSGQWEYGTDEVREHLKKNLKAIDRRTDEVSMDVKLALGELTEEQREAIFVRYVDDVTHSENANARKQLERAVDKLTRHMNRQRIDRRREWELGGRTRPGSRGGQAQVRDDYEGAYDEEGYD